MQRLCAFANKGCTCPPRETAMLGKCLEQPDSLSSRAFVDTDLGYTKFNSLIDTAVLAKAFGQTENRSWRDGRLQEPQLQGLPKMSDPTQHMGSWLQKGPDKHSFFLCCSHFILHISGFVIMCRLFSTYTSVRLAGEPVTSLCSCCS